MDSKLHPVPFSDKLLTDHFEDNSISYDVDYANSKYKGKKFLNYLYHIQIDTNVAVSLDLSYEERSELMTAWLNFRDVVHVDTLAFTLLNLLMVEKDGRVRFPSIFSEEESKRFIDENRELITRIVTFMDSIILFLLHKFDDQPIENFNVESIDDSNYIPRAVAQIFAIKDFFMYYALPFREKKWFVKQFEDHTNSIMMSFLLAEDNILLGFINAIVKNKITPERFCEFITTEL